MAYNNGFPIGYQPMYYQQYQQPVQQTQPTPTQNSGITWVQGEAGAKSFLVAPNTTVQLWDSEEQVIYLKSADASGMPSMRVLDYTIRDNAPVNALNKAQDNGQYVTKGEFNELKESLEKRFKSLYPEVKE